MTGLADDERLTVPRCHDLHPSGPRGAARALEICQVADVVDFDLVRGPTHLALLGAQPVHDFTPSTPERFRRSLADLDPSVPPQRDTTEVRH
jgi:hypothetical protein